MQDEEEDVDNQEAAGLPGMSDDDSDDDFDEEEAGDDLVQALQVRRLLSQWHDQEAVNMPL